MPSQRVHRYLDLMFFGKSYWKIHKALDGPSKALGRRHRRLYHDPTSAYFVAVQLYPGDPVAVRSAEYHIIIDNICTRDPEFGRVLEAEAMLYGGKRRRRRKSAQETTGNFSIYELGKLLK